MQREKFNELVEKYLGEFIQPEEKQQLAVFLQDPSYVELLDDTIYKELSDRIYELEPDEKIRQSIHSYLDGHTKAMDYSARRVHFLKTTWFRYAAAVIILLGAGAYLWSVNNGSTTPMPHSSTALTTATTDVAPGRERAILTLANGQQFILDSAHGNLVKQGNMTVVNLAGKLAYEGVGTGEFHTLTTPKGGQYQLVLPDGSKVWLNAASSITYPTAFSEKDRTVSITGEAYFEVANNKSKTFRVKTPKEEITVLGTRFNVNAYSDEATSKTSLLEGSIKIGITILKPGQAYRDGKIMTTNLEQDMAWKNGAFNFEGATVETFMRQLARWYDVQVVYKGKVPTSIFHGDMGRDLQLTQILEVLPEYNIHYKLEGKVLTIE